MAEVLHLLSGLGVMLGLVAFAASPVSRRRVERFAQRQRLTITTANGAQVIGYLATTRRWRVAGLAVGIVVSNLTPPAWPSTSFNLVVIVTGWFVGALVAEVRVAGVAYGSPRSASLQPRRPGRYLSNLTWALVPAAATVSLVAGAAIAVASAQGWAAPDWARSGALLAGSLVLASYVRMIQRRVVRRAQPLAAPDVIAADDAIRSRSLHVLSGGGAAVVLFLALNQLGASHPVAIRDSTIASIDNFGFFAVAAAGALVATSAWPRQRGAVRDPAPIAGT